MPVTASIDTASGTNILSTTTSIQIADIPKNQIDVRGCASYIEPATASAASTLTFGAVTNKGWVQDSGLFALELYANSGGSYYKIARITSDNLKITSSMLTKGEISQFGIAWVDS